MTTTPDEFFTDQTIQSLTKARIVSKYFKPWADLLGKRARKRGEAIRYLDLFAGRGRYADGTPSTPLLILQQVIDTPALHDLFFCRFNDADRETAVALKSAIQGLPGLEKLKHQPRIHCSSVDDKVAEWFEAKSYVATLTFLDPFGYAGLSARLIRATLKDEGSECVFFFNFNRVNAAIGNDSVEEHVKRLFDADDAKVLRDELRGLSPVQREGAVVKKLGEVLTNRKHAKHVLSFRFLSDDATRTSHYLVFATKSDIGAKIMKDIMAKESSWTEGGTPGYECRPTPKAADLSDLIDPIPELAEELLTAFAGKTVSVARVYLEHGLAHPHTPSQYKEALKLLESESKVIATPTADLRRENTLADHIEIQFPLKGE